jgi:hypothetical protein
MSLLDNPAFLADLANLSLGTRAVGAKYNVNKSTVSKYRARLGYMRNPAAPDTPADAEVLTGKANVTPEGGDFEDVQTTEPIADWAEVFKRFKLDPDTYVIVDDTVRMSTWQQSKRLDNGDRDTIDLYSYRARFTRKTSSLVDMPELTASLREWKPKQNNTPRMGEPVTMYVGWADWQLGKGEGDGTAGTKQRILDGFQSTVDRITGMRKRGINVDGLLLANMGDHTEAVTGHYTSQTYSVDLNQRDQLNLAIELNLTGIKALAPMFDKATYAACLCNHGQWQRVAGKALTDDSDNSTGFIGDTLHTVCDLHPALEHIDWIIPRDEMITTGRFSGVDLAMAHGHKVTTAEDAWLAKQSLWLQTTRNFRPTLWALAHRHTASVEDYGVYSRIQCSTEDPGSKSFTDGTGKFSSQGTTTFLMGSHLKRKYSDWEVL